MASAILATAASTEKEENEESKSFDSFRVYDGSSEFRFG